MRTARLFSLLVSVCVRWIPQRRPEIRKPRMPLPHSATPAAGCVASVAPERFAATPSKTHTPFLPLAFRLQGHAASAVLLFHQGQGPVRCAGRPTASRLCEERATSGTQNASTGAPPPPSFHFPCDHAPFFNQGDACLSATLLVHVARALHHMCAVRRGKPQQLTRNTLRCFGVYSENSCMPCIECTKDADEFCNVCWTDALRASPVIKLSCNHRDDPFLGSQTTPRTHGFSLLSSLCPLPSASPSPSPWLRIEIPSLSFSRFQSRTLSRAPSC